MAMRPAGGNPDNILSGPPALRWPAEAVWTFSTPQTIYVHHIASRAGHVVDAVLGEDFAGTLVTDFYAGYDHLLTTHQRCWRHLWRDLQDLLSAHAEDVETVAWVEGIGAIWKQATADRPAAELATTPQAARAREERARSYEQQVRALCPESLDPNLPHATLAKRLRRYGQELFTFVRDPRVDPTNNAAERSLRPLVVARKVSGGTRSAGGSQTRMILYSVCATARMQGKTPPPSASSSSLPLPAPPLLLPLPRGPPDSARRPLLRFLSNYEAKYSQVPSDRYDFVGLWRVRLFESRE